MAKGLLSSRNGAVFWKVMVGASAVNTTSQGVIEAGKNFSSISFGHSGVIVKVVG
jgi:hypothetical protein